jgi:hypothetical protein
VPLRRADRPAGRHRASQRPDRGAPAGPGPPGGAHPPQHLQRRSGALGRLAGQVRPGDSYRLADFLRTDGHRLRRLEPLSEVTRNLQALVRSRDDQVEAKVAATNQLAALLDAHWPGAGAVFGRLDSEIALAFLEAYPTPESAARLGEKRMARFLIRHSYCGRRTPAQLLARLQSAPVAPNRLDAEVLRELVLAQQARARGKRHPHAIRILMRAWLRVIWACWYSGTPYDPARHGGEQRAAA